MGWIRAGGSGSSGARFHEAVHHGPQAHQRHGLVQQVVAARGGLPQALGGGIAGDEEGRNSGSQSTAQALDGIDAAFAVRIIAATRRWAYLTLLR